jgi:AraC-like DNA-binding protein
MGLDGPLEVAADARDPGTSFWRCRTALEADTATLAARAGLSVSRFQQLFKATTGVTVRRFRLWARMRRAMAMAVAGATITHAALDAGFASPAHFPAAFREMFGMAPTRLLAGYPGIIRGSTGAREAAASIPSPGTGTDTDVAVIADRNADVHSDTDVAGATGQRQRRGEHGKKDSATNDLAHLSTSIRFSS